MNDKADEAGRTAQSDKGSAAQPMDRRAALKALGAAGASVPAVAVLLAPSDSRAQMGGGGSLPGDGGGGPGFG